MLRTHGRTMSLVNAAQATGSALYEKEGLRVLVKKGTALDFGSTLVYVTEGADTYVVRTNSVEHARLNIKFFLSGHGDITCNGWKSAELYTV